MSDDDTLEQRARELFKTQLVDAYTSEQNEDDMTQIIAEFARQEVQRATWGIENNRSLANNYALEMKHERDEARAQLAIAVEALHRISYDIDVNCEREDYVMCENVAYGALAAIDKEATK